MLYLLLDPVGRTPASLCADLCLLHYFRLHAGKFTASSTLNHVDPAEPANQDIKKTLNTKTNVCVQLISVLLQQKNMKIGEQ